MPNCTRDTFTKCYAKCETNGTLQCGECREDCSFKVYQDSGCFTYVLEQDEQCSVPLEHETIHNLTITSKISKYKMEPLFTELGIVRRTDICKVLMIPSNFMMDGKHLDSPSNSVVFLDIAGITGNSELKENPAILRICIIEALKRTVASINTMGRCINGKSSHIRILLSYLYTLRQREILKPDFFDEIKGIVKSCSLPIKSVDIIGFSAPPGGDVFEKFKSLHKMKKTDFSTRVYS